MFTDMEQWAEIRRRVLTGEISKRRACEEYAIHWDTLAKILTHAAPPGYRRTKRRASKLEPLLPVIQEILQSDRKVHRKQRHTARRIFERLRDEQGYTGGITIVKQAVRTWKRTHREVFLPLAHPPGEAQVDFGFADVWLDGELTKVALFVMTLPYSDAIFMQAFPRECTEAFLEGHLRAFAFFGGVRHPGRTSNGVRHPGQTSNGVPTRISYDNSRIAVGKIVGHRERAVTREFQRLKSHFLFQDHFCLVGRPNEKGHVERLLDFARRSFLVPVPRVRSLEELNTQLASACERDLSRTLRGKSGPKQVLLEEERQGFLRPLPAEAFEAQRIEQGQADSLSLVRFDRNSYSVPTQYAHRSITVVATIDEVRLVSGEEVVARHRRCWGKQQFFFDPLHYLALLERKPGGFDHARPFVDWDLPVCLGIFRRRLESELGGVGTRQFIQVLRLLERHTLPALKHAVQQALEIGATSADAVRLILEYQQEEPVGLFCLEGRPHLQLVRVSQTNVQAYQALLTLGSGNLTQGGVS